MRERAPDTWVFWVHASTTARFEEWYRKIAERVKIPDWDKPEADILQLVSSWLSDEANGRWVMIIDNADDSSVFSNPDDGGSLGTDRDRTQSLTEFLPQSPNGNILITSRSRDVAFKLTGSHLDIIKVEPMTQDHALALLNKKLSGQVDAAEAKELLQILDYMPLAISQAAAYISQRAPRITVSK